MLFPAFVPCLFRCLREWRYGSFVLLDGAVGSDAFRFAAEQAHEFLAHLHGLKHAAVGRGGGDGVLFLHSSHLHAHVFGLDDHHDTLWLERVVDAVHNLVSVSPALAGGG